MNEEQMDLVIDLYKQFMVKPAPEEAIIASAESENPTALASTMAIKLGQFSLNLWRLDSEYLQPESYLPTMKSDKPKGPRVIIDPEAFIKYTLR